MIRVEILAPDGTRQDFPEESGVPRVGDYVGVDMQHFLRVTSITWCYYTQTWLLPEGLRVPNTRVVVHTELAYPPKKRRWGRN